MSEETKVSLRDMANYFEHKSKLHKQLMEMALSIEHANVISDRSDEAGTHLLQRVEAALRQFYEADRR